LVNIIFNVFYCLSRFKEFSDLQILLARNAYTKLAQTKEGREKIKELKRLNRDKQ
jgi:hypothetical protein